MFFILFSHNFCPEKTLYTMNSYGTWIRPADADTANNNLLLTQIVNLPGFDTSKARFATQYSTRSSPEKSVMEIVPTAAELMLPWRRDHSYQSFGTSVAHNSVHYLRNFVSLFLFNSSFLWTFVICDSSALESIQPRTNVEDLFVISSYFLFY